MILWLSSPRACSRLYEAISYSSKRILKFCYVGNGIIAHVSKQDHVNTHNRQLHDIGVVNCLVGKVHSRLEDRKRRLGANGVSPYFQILLDGPNMLVGAVCCLLYNRLCVSGEGIDKVLL
jgi:hypothetical protein